MSRIRIASVQLNSQTDIDQNLIHIKNAINEAASHAARLVVLPENACVMGRQDELAARYDEMCAFYQSLARQHKLHIVAGTLPCPKRADGTAVPNERFRQVSLLLDDTGEVKARYDKIHLFRATVDDSTGSYDENKTFEAGEQMVVAHCQIDGVAVGVGMMICFDVRFASLASRLRQMGADIISVPAAFTHRTGQAHWQLLLQARALDSQCMMIGSAQGGTHHIGSHTRQTWGHSLIANAHGQVLTNTNCDELDKPYHIVYADFDKSEQNKIRRDMPIFACHRLA